MNQDWERQLDSDLKNLPQLEAPIGMTSNVLERIEVYALPFWKRPWSYWTWYQHISLIVTAIFLGGFVIQCGGILFEHLGPIRHVAHVFGTCFTAIWTILSVLSETVRILIHSAKPVFWLGLCIAAFFLYVTSVGALTALIQIVKHSELKQT